MWSTHQSRFMRVMKRSNTWLYGPCPKSCTRPAPMHPLE